MGGFAWVTLATNDSYSLGALVLANSLKQAGTAHQLVVLVTPGVTPSMRGKLSQVFDVVQEVNILDSQDKTNLKLLKRPELGITFTKLHCWRLTQYDKCVFLDADTLVLQNCDELFEREELSAAPDVGWPDCFNSGVFVYKPSNSTYENLIEFALDKGSFDGGDQGLLNLYFSDWAHKDISKHLPFIYNVCSTAFYSYLPAFKQYGKNAKIIHFIGNSKPWLLYFDSESKKVKPPSELYHITAILQLWWDIFCSKVHENLSREMTTSANMKIVTATSSNSQSYRPHTNTHIQIEEPISFHEPISYYQKNTHQDYHIPRSPSPPPTPQLNFHNVWDPWEEYLQNQDNSHANVDNIPTESHNTNADSRDDHNQLNEHIPATVQTEYLNNYVEQHNDQANDTYIPPISEQNSCNHFDEQTHCDYTDISNTEQIPLNTPDTSQPSSTYDIIQTSSSFDIISTPSECETEGQCEFIHDEEATEDAGLAGALAQMTLGVPRTAEQEALEDHYRKQCWELGNIDYLGKDSFDNIWQKICETLATGPAAGQEKTVETVKQEATVEKVEEKRAEEKPVEPIKQEPTVQKVEEKSAEVLKEALPPQEPVPVQQQEPVPQTIQTEDILTCQLKTEEPKEQVAPAEPLKECEQPKTEKSPEVKQDDKTKTPSPPKETSAPPKPEEVKTAAPPVATTTPSDVAATIKDIKNEPSENSQKSPLEIAPKPSETGLPPANIETPKEAETPAQKVETEHVAEISQKTESQPTTDTAPSAPVAEAPLPVEPQAPLVIPQKEQVPTTPSVQAEPPKFPEPAPVELTKPLESAAPETKTQQEPVKVLETVSNQQSAAKESPPQTPAESPKSPEGPKPQIPVPQVTNEPPTTKETSPQSTKEPLKTSDTPKPSETPSLPTSSETKVQPVQPFKETSLLNEPKVSESKLATPVTESSTPTEKSQSSEPRQPANPTPPPRKAASGNKKPTKKK